jgi:hypothetical protein
MQSPETPAQSTPGAVPGASPPRNHGKPVRADWRVLGIPALAAALALVIWLCIPVTGRLPHYELELPGAAGRPPPSTSPEGSLAQLELPPAGALRVVLRPSAPPSAPIEARAFLADGMATDRAAEPVAVSTEAAGPGVLRLAVNGKLLPAKGRLIVLIGLQGTLPGSPSTGTAAHGHGWQRFDIAFTHASAAR